MAEEPKKISFGFSKISKKPSIAPPKNDAEKDIQFIDSLEDNSIKLINGEENGNNVLIIPLKKANVLRDNMIETLKARKEERALKQTKNVKDDKKGSLNVSAEEDDKKPLTLDEMAAKEILEDLKKTQSHEDAPSVREIPATNISSAGEKEPTLENYESTPIQEFGLAVLRGMGWTPESDIIRNGQIVQPDNPVLRTKGLGLGADKVLPTTAVSNNGEELVMKKNAVLKIVSGPYKNLYGKVEGFDDLPGRLMVRLTLQNSVISISENLVQLITAAEYNKCSKVLNLDDYNKFYEKKDMKVNEDQEKSCRNETRRSPSKSEDKGTINRRQRKENRRSVSPYPNAEVKYTKPWKVERRSSSLSPEPEKNFRKSYKNRNRSSSLDSNTEKKRHRNRRDRSSSLDKDYSKRKKDKKRNSSSSPGKQYRKTKKKVRTSSESSESRDDYKTTKTMKYKKRNSSSSSESEGDKRKNKKKRELSENDRKKQKSLKKRYSSSSSEGGKYKSRYNPSGSSDSEVSRSSKFEKKIKKSKHPKKDKYYSNLPPERNSSNKKHTAKNHFRSRSPKNKKKIKKHHRSRS